MQRPFQCQICKATIDSSTLLLHLRMSNTEMHMLCGAVGLKGKDIPVEYDDISMMDLLTRVPKRPRKKILCEKCGEAALQLGIADIKRSPMVLQCSGCKRQVYLCNKQAVPKYTWCSESCRNAYRYRKREKSDPTPTTMIIPSPRACSVCFKSIPSPTRTQKTCSHGCRQKAYRMRFNKKKIFL